jgi:hypothetical protein
MNQEKPSVSQANVVRLDKGILPRDMFGPFIVDQAVRQAISHFQRQPSAIRARIVKLGAM